jgi:rubrerythrin
MGCVPPPGPLARFFLSSSFAVLLEKARLCVVAPTFFAKETAMDNQTQQNLYTAFVGEAKAFFRLLAYADRAAQEDLVQIAALFRAVAEAERVHAQRNLELLSEIILHDTETNLQASFEREERASGVFYPRFIQEAEAAGERAAALAFSQARDVEEQHAALYKRALDHLIADTTPAYFVCQVCGHVAEGEAPEQCPVCGVGAEYFRLVG